MVARRAWNSGVLIGSAVIVVVTEVSALVLGLGHVEEPGQGLQEHHERHKEKGNGFYRSFTTLDGTEKSIGTIVKSYYKINVGPFVDILLHELSHAIFDMLQLPIFGR